jgi:hypothetical protein
MPKHEIINSNLLCMSSWDIGLKNCANTLDNLQEEFGETKSKIFGNKLSNSRLNQISDMAEIGI